MEAEVNQVVEEGVKLKETILQGKKKEDEGFTEILLRRSKNSFRIAPG
jgi:hypothetical protein